MLLDSMNNLSSHQVELDVLRSLNHLLPSDTRLSALAQHRQHLALVITELLTHYPSLHYYQGFHDIASTFLLTLGPTLAKKCLPSLSLLFLRDYMSKSLSPCLAQLSLLFPLISFIDPDLSHHLSKIEGLEAYCCLSWILTWCSHDVDDADIAARIIDWCLGRNPLCILYLIAATIVSRKSIIMMKGPDDFPEVHTLLSKFPSHPFIDTLISSAEHIYTTIPPHQLQRRANIYLGKNSVVNRYNEDVKNVSQLSPFNLNHAYYLAELPEESFDLSLNSKSQMNRRIKNKRWMKGMGTIVVVGMATAVIWFGIEFSSMTL